jgi:hypothetical protein
MHKWKWVQNQELLKPLDMSFDLYLETQDVDDFLIGKIKKKLTYWCSIHCLLGGRSIIVNQVYLLICHDNLGSLLMCNYIDSITS